MLEPGSRVKSTRRAPHPLRVAQGSDAYNLDTDQPYTPADGISTALKSRGLILVSLFDDYVIAAGSSTFTGGSTITVAGSPTLEGSSAGTPAGSKTPAADSTSTGGSSTGSSPMSTPTSPSLPNPLLLPLARPAATVALPQVRPRRPPNLVLSSAPLLQPESLSGGLVPALAGALVF
ncbi:hypothetical protein BDR04DRAFT_1228142 [Suillus decipiens]|nr:hypothetical protein BDR04DRAFT_1228142 [Suillus decipiens]